MKCIVSALRKLTVSGGLRQAIQVGYPTKHIVTNRGARYGEKVQGVERS